MLPICNCNYCAAHRRYAAMKTYTLQQEFESVCFMYEHIESELKVAVDKFNGGKPLNNTQKQVLAKAIWRN